ncbi:MAG: putative TonB-dependent receptor [Verrucomicrobia bacterium]|nr:putative TonB-dependent receptor [Verrucomicrobiota bacterium]
MTPRPLFLCALFGTSLTALAAPPDQPLAALDHPIGFELSPLSPSATELPLPTPENTFVRELDDLSGRVPNLFVSSTGRHSLGDVYSMRGFTNGRLFTEPSVGVYVDGVPLGSAFTYAEPLYAIDHVDVFRSPQTTLFGLGSEGGLIDIQTRHADPREWHGEASGLYGDFRTVEHRIWLGGPLIEDKLTLELGGFAGTTQGFVDNTFLGGRRDDRDTRAGRAVLTWTPRNDWGITAGFEGTRSDDGASRLTGLGGDPFQVRSDEPGSLKLDNTREWLAIGKKFDGWEIRSTTAHQSWKVNPAVQDADLSPASAKPFFTELPENAESEFFANNPGDGEVLRLSLRQEVWSEELRIQSRGAADEPWWKAGLFFQSKGTTGENDREQRFTDFEPQVIPLAPTVFSFPGFPALGLPAFSFVDGNVAFRDFLRGIPYTDRTRFALHDETWATYVNAGRRWGGFALEGGVRLTYTRHRLERSDLTEDLAFPGLDGDSSDHAFDAALAQSERMAPGSAPGQPIDLFPATVKVTTRHRFSAEDDDVNFTPAVGLTFDLSKKFQLFAHSSYFVKPGGFNPLVSEDARSQYRREEIWATEAGVRAAAWDGRLQAQLTGYVNSIKDYQLDIGSSDYFITNAGRARSVGAEFELACRLLRHLDMSGAVGWNQTELTQILRGNQVPFVPTYTALVALDYRPLPGFSAHLECRVIGDTEYSVTIPEPVHQNAYGELNARVGYERSKFGIYLFGKNLSDTKRYTQQSYRGTGSTGEPRILGVMALVKF